MKKIESKRKTFQEAKKRIYYMFFCKCGEGFNSFPGFLEHVKTSHKIENLDFQEILTKKNGIGRELSSIGVYLVSAVIGFLPLYVMLI